LPKTPLTTLNKPLPPLLLVLVGKAMLRPPGLVTGTIKLVLVLVLELALALVLVPELELLPVLLEDLGTHLLAKLGSKFCTLFCMVCAAKIKQGNPNHFSIPKKRKILNLLSMKLKHWQPNRISFW
jgi:hypothetical protein